MESTNDNININNDSDNSHTSLNMKDFYKIELLYSEYTSIMNYIIQCCNILTDSAILKNLIDSEKSNSLQDKKLEEALKSLIDYMAYIKLQENILSQISKESNKDINLEVKFQELYTKKKKEYDSQSSAQKYFKKDEYIDFKQRILNVHRKNARDLTMESIFQETFISDDEDIVISYLDQNIKCPLTMTYLEKPLKSNICGHYFSEHAILEILKSNNGKYACPIVGCSKIIDNSVLVYDKIMERRVNIAKEFEKDFDESEKNKESGYINLE
ncbi:hypothetical protein T552_02435 [Pneumocystis carinii B80]|uniref:SP-RING-type domain-containing protein n=1 Tax=Pneumocystis carinii (strain B80) TaxID=1408658 RepID=A0A0W4ZF01_PNEC8|nr:hypothetical protein T552_02435 [Pneumocystis carinii B80]KTW26946.1 hypothetical protein T552_02435 [Pneumocystis carinii B80]